MRRTAQETKALILNTAKEHFARSGFDGVRVDDLAHSAGVNKATIYYHFKDKSYLFEHILIDMTKMIHDEVYKRQKSCTNSTQRLEAFIDALLYIVKSQRNMARILMQELGFTGKHLSDEVKKRFLSILQVIIEILDEGVKNAEFKEINPVLLHTIVVGGFNYYLSTSEIVGEKLPIEFGEKEEDKLKEMILVYVKKD